MSPLERIASRARQRAQARRFLNRLGPTVAISLTIALTALILDRLIGPGLVWWWPIAAGLLLGAAAGALSTLITPAPDSIDATGEVDRALALKDRLASAISLGANQGDDPFVALAVEDATDLAQRVNVRQAIPIRVGGWWWAWPPLIAVVLGVAIFVPNMRLLHDAQAEANRIEISDRREQAAADIAEVLEQSESLRPTDDTETADPIIEEQLAKLDELRDQLAGGGANADEARSKAAEHLGDLAQTLEDRSASAERDASAIEELFEKLGEADAVGEGGGGEGREDAIADLAEAMRQADPEAGAEALSQLERELEQMTEEERARAAEALRELAEDLDELADTAEQEHELLAERAADELHEQGLTENTTSDLLEQSDERDLQSDLKDRGLDEDAARRLAERLAENNRDRESTEQAEREAREAAQAMREAADQAEAPEPSPPKEPHQDEQTTPPPDPTDEPSESESDQQRDQTKPGQDESPSQDEPTEQGKEGEQGEQEQQDPNQQQREQDPSGDPNAQQSPAQQEQQPSEGTQQRPSQDEKQPSESDPSQPEPSSEGQPQDNAQPSQQPNDQGQSPQPDPNATEPGEQPGAPSNEQDGQPSQQPTDENQSEDQGARQGEGEQPQDQQPSQQPSPGARQAEDDSQSDSPQQGQGAGGDEQHQPESDQPNQGQSPTDDQTRRDDAQQLGSEPSDAPPDDAQGIERMREQLERMRQRRDDAQQDREQAQRAREQAEKLLEGMTPEERDQLERWAREALREQHQADANNPQPFQTEDLDLRRTADAERVIAELDRPGDDSIAHQPGAVSNREMVDLLTESLQSAEHAMEERVVPARYSNVERYFRQAIERIEKDAETESKAEPAKDAQDAS